MDNVVLLTQSLKKRAQVRPNGRSKSSSGLGGINLFTRAIFTTKPLEKEGGVIVKLL
jgi:hypothetical protein